MIALDTETTLIPTRRVLLHHGDEINLSPYVTPRLVVGSWAKDDGTRGLLPPEDFCALVAQCLAAGEELVFHHAPFDVDVLCEYDPRLWPAFREALDAGRIHDTKTMDVLYRISTGYFDRPDPNNGWRRPEVKNRSLDALSQAYLGEATPKDLRDEDGDLVRLSYAKWEGRFNEMPKLYRDYAQLDAVQTLRVWQYLSSHAQGNLGEPLQVRADLPVYALDKRGLCIDRVEADRLFHLFSQDMPELQEALVAHGLGEWLPLEGTKKKVKHHGADRPAPEDCGRWYICDGQLRRLRLFKHHWTSETAQPYFHLFTLHVREKLEALALEMHLSPKRTEKTDQISLVAEDWKDVVPADREDLQAWLKHERLKKILGTYLVLYRQLDTVYPSWKSIGARSTRMACARPNAQNVSKRKHGIRSLFVPEPGFVFVKADYTCQELFTLAQAMLDMGIKGPLFAAIQSGADLHCRTASMLLNLPEESIGKKSPERQAAKAVNFGAPGGLGVKKLADYARKEYGVVWTFDQAKQMKEKFFTVYPDVAEFLARHKTDLGANLIRVSGRGPSQWKEILGVQGGMWELREAMRTSPDRWIRGTYYEAERSLEVRLRTGFIRKGCTYTEGANTNFQGLAAAVTKEAGWNVHKRGGLLTMLVHDELITQCPPEEALSEARLLEQDMLQAFRTICPDVGQYAKVEVEAGLLKWGSAKDKDGNDV